MKILLEEKVLGTQSKKNSKYYWILETITGKNEVAEKSEDEDYLMTSSETGYVQNVKEEIIEKINSENVFSFSYEPKEGDYLSIKNNLRKNEYLNLIFLNNKWIEEIYACSYRDCDGDIYTTIKTGVAFLSDNEIFF
ncbi:hypothetical protein [Chryseobacterium aquaticum]|jgi:hypothetical protein|uniref:Uncharacterized protein n=1 Tax=Chryseobacterium aquaticum subsp. greenlandense TaxID=345663 RepID=A0A101CES3_9FLAO|nr:hypothetical protein [Chryseobacterium aquaticum]KUJ54903.1 hypothetical protein AR686_15200 [Chryseobacterium aquaticum subsp. greenlandense]